MCKKWHLQTAFLRQYTIVGMLETTNKNSQCLDIFRHCLWSPHFTHTTKVKHSSSRDPPTHTQNNATTSLSWPLCVCRAACHLIQSFIYFSCQLLSTKDCQFWIPWYRVHADLHTSVSIKKGSVLTLLVAADFFVSLSCFDAPKPQHLNHSHDLAVPLSLSCCTSLVISISPLCVVCVCSMEKAGQMDDAAKVELTQINTHGMAR